MAKKTNRQLVSLDCSECKNKNYTSQKNVNNTKDKLSVSKFCRHCRKQTPHTEGKIK